MAYERAKKTYSATTIEAVVAVGKTRRLKPAESNIVIRHVFDSLAESAKSFKQWDEAWRRRPPMASSGTPTSSGRRRVRPTCCLCPSA